MTYTVRAPETMPVYLGYRVDYVRQNGTTTAKDFCKADDSASRPVITRSV
ncbi:hypothetical protein L3X07_03350 [Levilactobacillus brevis]|nr:hypothetical protein [Levilactobacillus brevis]